MTATVALRWRPPLGPKANAAVPMAHLPWAWVDVDVRASVVPGHGEDDLLAHRHCRRPLLARLQGHRQRLGRWG